MADAIERFRDEFSQGQRVRALAVLERLADESPLWKKRIHDDVEIDISIQTLGRDVDRLDEIGLLDHVPVMDGRMYVAYELSDDGREVVENHRVCTLCEDVVDADHSHDYEVLPATDYLGGER